MKTLVIVLISLISINANSQVHAKVDNKVIWVSGSAEKANIKVDRGHVESSQSLIPGQLNIRAQIYGTPIEVYNSNASKWFPTHIMYVKDKVLSNEQTEKMRSLSECDTVSEITTQFEDVTEFAEVYVDGYKYGNTGNSGMFKKRTGANCKGDSSEFSLRKNKCDTFKDSAVLTSSPYLYKKSNFTLKCK